MYKILEYVVLLFVLVLLQAFLFNGLSLSVYLVPLVYVAFIALLPMGINNLLALILAFGVGMLIDLTMGTPGLNTIASLTTAFVRPTVLTLTVGKDDATEGGAPTSRRLGRNKFMRYIFLMVFLHCAVFCIFEALTWNYFYLTLLRIVVSTVVTVAVVYLIQLFFKVKG